MISRINNNTAAEMDAAFETEDCCSFDYSDVIVKKPWGYEYLVFENEFVAIWMLQIVRKRKTSMHSHPRKKTGLIMLSGHGTFHWKDDSKEISAMDAVNIDKGVFHSTEASSSLPIHPVSEDGIWVMEIESPPIKKDLCRIDDAYGRAGESYEDTKHMVFEPKEKLRLEIPDKSENIRQVKYHDLNLSIRKGPIYKDKNFPERNALISVIGLDQYKEYDNPYLIPGEVFQFDDFYNNTNDDDLKGILSLVIEKQKKLLKLTDYISSYLAELGIRHIFAVCGGGAMHLVDSFGNNDKIEYIATHHEQAAAMAAEGYARISGKPGAALVTSGPGGTNAITGVCGAWIDSIPAIFISGQVTSDTLIKDTGLRQFGIQEGNIIDMVKPVTKYAVTINQADKMRYHLEKACYLAMTGRPGPVWLDIPLDIQSKIINPEEQESFSPKLISDRKENFVLKGLVSQCLNLIKKAERPVLIYGYGVRLSGAEKLLVDLIGKLKIPVVSSWTASDIIPFDHENYIGRSGIMGDRAGNFTVQNSDLVLIIGSRMSIPQVGYNYRLFAREAIKIVVDIDSKELSKPSLSSDLPIHSDAGSFISELLDHIEKKDFSGHKAVAWKIKCMDWKKKYPVVLPEYADNSNKVNSFYFIDLLSNKLDKNDVIVTDMGTSFTCTMQAFRTKEGQRLFTSSGLASMGFGLPGAIGACLANERQKTILITGDGGLQMNIQELQTVCHYNLPLIIFVLNNSGYLTIKLMQQNHFGKYTGSDPSSGLSCPDIMKIATAYGIACKRISDQAELHENIDSVLMEKGPFICEIMMPEDQPLIPRVSSLKLPDGTIISKPMEDLYPFLDRDEFNENMLIKQVEILNK